MRNGKRATRRGAVLATDPPDRQLRGEVAAIAVLAFALLSLVAIATGQGTLLGWWRGVLVGLLGAGAARAPPALPLSPAALRPGRGAVLGWGGGGLGGLPGAGAALVPPVLGLFAAAFWWPRLRSRLVMPLVGATLSALALLAIAEITFTTPDATGS